MSVTDTCFSFPVIFNQPNIDTGFPLFSHFTYLCWHSVNFREKSRHFNHHKQNIIYESYHEWMNSVPLVFTKLEKWPACKEKAAAPELNKVKRRRWKESCLFFYVSIRPLEYQLSVRPSSSVRPPKSSVKTTFDACVFLSVQQVQGGRRPPAIRMS
jgi:hypothetical protein